MHATTPSTQSAPDLSLDELEDGLLLLDSERRVVRVNRAFRRLLSLPDGRDLSGANGMALVRTHIIPLIADAEAAGRLLAALRAGTVLSRLEFRIAPDRWVACSIRVQDDGTMLLLVSDITARKESEEKYRQIAQEHSRYRDLFDLAPDGYFVCDPRGAILDVNRAGALLLGSERENLIGTSSLACIIPECRETFRDLLTRLKSGPFEPLRGIEVWVQPAAGEPIPVSLSVTAVRDDRGSLAEVRWLARDITRRKRVDAEREWLLAENQSLAVDLAEERDLLRTVMEYTDVHLAYLDAEFRFVRVNTAYAEGSGYTEEDLLGKRHFDLFPNPENQAIFERVRDTGEAFRVFAKPFTYETQPERGKTYWDWSLVPVKDAEGSVLGLVFSLADVTERMRAEEEVRIRNRRLAVLNAVITASASSFTLGELLDNALDAVLDNLGFDIGMIYMLEGKERIQAVLRCHRKVSEFALMQNRTLNARQWPYNRVFVAGQPWFVEGTESAGSRERDVLADFEVASLACIPLVAESSVVGALMLGSTTGPEIPTATRQILVAVGREVGAGALRGILYQRLEAANREANLYLDILTHDIRNVDNVANIYADLLMDMLGGEERRYLQKLRAGIKKSMEITANVGTIRKIRESRVRLIPVDLDEVVRAEITHYPDTRITYEGTNVTVLADDLLPEVFTNLIGNAAKHGGPNVEVAVTVEDADEEGMVQVTVADTGPGVPDNAKERIFTRFEQRKAGASGHGLGLSICRMLLNRYGGRIRVEDRVTGRSDEGAAFRFTLRKSEGDEPREHAASGHTPRQP
ncbi:MULTISPECIES: PAS domain S-box protein [unclassified Methanoculleus]|uniref:PAS domain S-box protein n=1 Tax=unclassified Methanoculleus TaxID=2619537 RepID=UPI0025E26EB3|nr:MULTISPECIES: PAS domain S-box protein [unclassified Methanoculleus]MCK9317673.1 PAS domain S-box protein [Methanoculleus sp.]MDD2253557.1 PAS domain S-box protein [Methanoculleus sp.]MDD2786530.1 PAS domain S-box protein [Methanoculleus sp.]MDD3215621.1 PAS domain S-box protein [Methanoculleus sp.]MDD4313459.1 PAS domain S-box protein [Methanoculleus sp.]